MALSIVGAITLARLCILFITPLQLYPDEAQYWWWAQSPDWGYFSKPPLIAWIVWTTTRLSDAEWAIRLASPLLHAATAPALFGIGRLAYDARVGFWSALAYITLPGISYSSGLISTDVPLLLCWAVALYAFLRARTENGWQWPIICGLGLGIGLLAKYAMLYFLLGGAIAALFDPATRRLALSFRGLAIVALGLLIVLPNLIWNAQHGFPTLKHTEANADWNHARYSLGHAAAFGLGQFGVFGPLMMAGWIGGLLGWRRGGDAGLVLAAFSVPLLILIVFQSFISEANANWAAAAYVAAVPLAVATLLRWWNARLLWISLGLGSAAMLALWTAQVSPALADRAGFGNALKRQQGWRELGAAVVNEAGRVSYDAISAANRSVLAELLYYAQPRAAPIRAWDRGSAPNDHFQMTMPLRAGARNVLLVAQPDESSAMLASFDSAQLMRRLTIPLGRHHSRVLVLYNAHFYRGPPPTISIAPD
ncbi:MAG: glycosyltransferase family 39 protein [Alphaproteobacteria bacterium]|nr:glycosyltransferase family 39 protein [Alphaproteobacteria bacterium]